MADHDVIVLSNIELPASIVTQIRELSPRVRVVTAAQLSERPQWLHEAEVLFTQLTDPASLREASELRWIQTMGAGVEWLLVPEIVQNPALRLTNASGVHSQPIAEHVFGFILMFAHSLHLAVAQQQHAQWRPPPLRDRVHTLDGKTLGVLGVGAIGQRCAQLGRAFGMRVIGLRRSAQACPELERSYQPPALHEFLAQSHYVINTLPLTEATRGLIGAEQFEAMRRDSVLINIGRGGTIDTDALVEALRNGIIAGAALDVVEPEPLPPEHPLWRMPNVVITPHYSGYRPDYMLSVGQIFLDNLGRYLDGRPLLNEVDKAAGY